MTDSQDALDEKLLLTDAFLALQDHFQNYEGFHNQYKNIPDTMNIRFLRLASVYRNLVKDGNFNVPPEALTKSNDNFYDITYKYIALISIIEAVVADDTWIDFYQWLRKKAKNKEIKAFPIENQNELDELYKQYKSEFGAISSAVKFFKALEEREQEFLQRKLGRLKNDQGKFFKTESTITELAKLLYDVRSEFVHSAKLIPAFSDSPSVIANHRSGPFTSSLTLNQLMHIFEIGFMRHFGIRPDHQVLLF